VITTSLQKEANTKRRLVNEVDVPVRYERGTDSGVLARRRVSHGLQCSTPRSKKRPEQRPREVESMEKPTKGAVPRTTDLLVQLRDFISRQVPGRRPRYTSQSRLGATVYAVFLEESSESYGRSIFRHQKRVDTKRSKDVCWSMGIECIKEKKSGIRPAR
jgi:hypothetical protein